MKKLLFLSLAATLWLSSCSQETILSDENSNGQVVFKGNMAKLQTRVNGSLWDGGDKVGIYMIKSDPGTLTAANIVAGYSNKEYTTVSGPTATFTPVDGGEMYYPNNGSNVKFLAYHPYRAAISDDFKLLIDVGPQHDQSAIDVLYAPITTANYSKGTNEAVPLAFEHKLVKLVFKISKADGATFPVGIEVSIPNQYTMGTLDLTNGTVATDGSTSTLTTISTYNTSTAIAEAIVFPGAANMNVTFYNHSGQLYTATIPDLTWVAGNLYTYIVTLSDATNTATSITGTAANWNNMGDEDINGMDHGDISWCTGPGPYTINNAEKLKGLAYLVNSGIDNFAGKTINLTAYIDLHGVDWKPIGTYTKPFKGTFNGNGKEISGLTVDLFTNIDIGLFGCVEGGTIKKLGIVNANIIGLSNVGGIAGYVDDGEITHCYVSGQISGSYSVGGLAGSVVGTSRVFDCYTLCDVVGIEYIGGVAGKIINSQLVRCYATGAVSGSKYVGGIAGSVQETTIGFLTNCVALNSSVSYNGAGSALYFGRITGSFDTGTLDHSKAWENMGGEVTLFTDKVHDEKDGADISAADAKNQYSYYIISWLFHSTDGPWKMGTGTYSLPVLIWQTTMPDMPAHL